MRTSRSPHCWHRGSRVSWRTSCPKTAVVTASRHSRVGGCGSVDPATSFSFRTVGFRAVSLRASAVAAKRNRLQVAVLCRLWRVWQLAANGGSGQLPNRLAFSRLCRFYSVSGLLGRGRPAPRNTADITATIAIDQTTLGPVGRSVSTEAIDPST